MIYIWRLQRWFIPGLPGSLKATFSGLLDLSPIDRWVADTTPVQGKLYAGGTVTACGMDVAVRMGCSPVMTAGLDLSFDNAGPSMPLGPCMMKIRCATT